MPNTRSIELPPLPGSDEDCDLAHALTRIEQVRAIQREWGPALIAGGIFGGYDPWSCVLEALAQSDPHVAEAERQLTAFFEQSGRNVRIPFPLKDDPDHEDWVSDVAATRAYAWGDAGFMLGLAVGMLLGPHAFGVQR